MKAMKNHQTMLTYLFAVWFRNLLPASNMMADLARASQSGLKRSTSSSPMAQTPSSGLGRGSPGSRSQSCSPTASDNLASMRDDVCQVPFIHHSLYVFTELDRN